MSDSRNSWDKFLNPEVLRSNLIAISLFVSAFETFKRSIIEKPETFFSNGFDQNGLIFDNRYKTEVLSRDRNLLFASMYWLKKMGAVDDSDIEIFKKVYSHRNSVVHEMFEFVSNAERNLDMNLFQSLVDLIEKIEKWWLINFELAIDPEMVPEGANPEDAIPFVFISLQLMFDIASGREPEEGFYYKMMKNGHA